MAYQKEPNYIALSINKKKRNWVWGLYIQKPRGSDTQCGYCKQRLIPYKYYACIGSGKYHYMHFKCFQKAVKLFNKVVDKNKALIEQNEQKLIARQL